MITQHALSVIPRYHINSTICNPSYAFCISTWVTDNYQLDLPNAITIRSTGISIRSLTLQQHDGNMETAVHPSAISAITLTQDV